MREPDVKRSRSGRCTSPSQVMPVRASRIVGKHLRPDPRRELIYQWRRLLTVALEHVNEIVEKPPSRAQPYRVLTVVPSSMGPTRFPQCFS